VRPIYTTGTPLPPKPTFYIFFSTNICTEHFKHAAHSPFFFFFSKCRLFHKATFFVSCIIRILRTGCAKIKMPNFGAEGLNQRHKTRWSDKQNLKKIYFKHFKIYFKEEATRLTPPPL
jgi:hypothetical protein